RSLERVLGEDIVAVRVGPELDRPDAPVAVHQRVVEEVASLRPRLDEEAGLEGDAGGRDGDALDAWLAVEDGVLGERQGVSLASDRGGLGRQRVAEVPEGDAQRLSLVDPCRRHAPRDGRELVDEVNELAAIIEGRPGIGVGDAQPGNLLLEPYVGEAAARAAMLR